MCGQTHLAIMTLCSLPRLDDNVNVRVDSKFQNKPRITQEKEFYCKDFQKGECNLSSPHRSWVKLSYETVEHFCFLCFKAKMGKLPHSLITDDCPNKK